MADYRLRDLYGDATPPPALRARVLATMERQGTFTQGGSRLTRGARVAATLAAGLLVGFLAGRMQPHADSPGQYVLLLFEGDGYRDDRPMREIVAEYGAWADSLDRAGSLVLASRLSQERARVSSSSTLAAPEGDDAAPTGMFIVRALNLDSAAAIARTSPHVRQGGEIVVRPMGAQTSGVQQQRDGRP